MGKKLQGAKLRAKKRAAAALEELQEQQADVAAALTVSTKADADLFVLDTQGETVPHHKRPSRQHGNSKDQKFKKDAGLSEKEQKQVARLQEKHKHDATKLQQLAEQGRRQLARQSQGGGRARKGGHRTRTNFDLWDQEESTDVVNSTSATKQQKESKETSHKNNKRKNEVAVDVAKTGQSYLPDPVAHRSILRKAAAVEVKREAKKRHLEAPLSQGMSAETKALLLGDSDDEDEDDDEDDSNKEDDNNTKLGPVIPKRANKRTRAQRNQQKRRRIELALQQKSKRAKTLLNQVGEIGRYRKELKRQAQEQQQAAAEKQKLLQQEKNRPRGRDVEFRAAADGKSGGGSGGGGGLDPVHAPLVAVALPDEVGGGGSSSGTRSLRTLQPKGSLARERVLSWADRQKVEVSSLTSGAGAAGGGPRRTKKKRKLAVKGRRNQDTVGARFELLG